MGEDEEFYVSYASEVEQERVLRKANLRVDCGALVQLINYEV